jgi:uncharacterized protein YjbJ (UPF0337 family)
MGGAKNKLEGNWDEAKGKVKEAVGDATDDESTQADGVRDQVKGKGKQAWGNVKDAAEDVKEGVKRAVS